MIFLYTSTNYFYSEFSNRVFKYPKYSYPIYYTDYHVIDNTIR